MRCNCFCINEKYILSVKSGNIKHRFIQGQ